jgi:hypothetical protein
MRPTQPRSEVPPHTRSIAVELDCTQSEVQQTCCVPSITIRTETTSTVVEAAT